MNLTRFSQISEIVTGLAIVITLVVLVLEVNGNTRAMEYQLELERYDRLFGIADSDYLPPIMRKIKAVDEPEGGVILNTYMDRYDLTLEEAERWVRYMGVIWSGLQSEHGYGKDNSNYIRALLENTDQHIYWQTIKDTNWYDPDFVAYVEDVRQ